MDEYFRQNPWTLVAIAVVVLWSAVWKAFALWKAARAGDKVWFLALFVINTLGLLEIFYLFAFSKRRPEPQESIDIKPLV